jgi:hypothetical protein
MKEKQQFELMAELRSMGIAVSTPWQSTCIANTAMSLMMSKRWSGWGWLRRIRADIFMYRGRTPAWSALEKKKIG